MDSLSRSHRNFAGQLILAIFAMGQAGDLVLAAPQTNQASDDRVASYDVVIYGGTSAAVTTAVQAKRMGKSVVIVCPDKHLGGMTSGGLGWTDSGKKEVVGGLSREFYHRIWQYYERPESWRWQLRKDFRNSGQGTRAIDDETQTAWTFEPHVAERVYEDFIAENEIPVLRDEWLDRQSGVVKEAGRIVSISTLNGKTFRGKVFIDATYEGDLLAAAGVKFHVGREANSVYDETWNGVQVGTLHHRHHFGVLKTPLDPYRTPGDKASGLLPRISADPPGIKGEGDHRVQAYCFRMCLTKTPENRLPFEKPENYDASRYELLLRVFAAGWREEFHKFDSIPNSKTDVNNHGPFSTDNIGFNYDYPEASYPRRKEIIDEHRNYQLGLMYFLANDPRVPEEVRSKMSQWGLAKDEFADNEGWPYQIYVREARRMVGRYLMTEHELLKRRPTPESIGMGSYTIDSHNVQRYVTPEGHVQNEGDIGVPTKGAYAIALGSIQPKRDECENLLTPTCVSSSHIAYGSIRMEPVFMILGQSAATVAAMAIDGGKAVQDVEYEKLRARLLSDKQVLDAPAAEKAKPTIKVTKDGYPSGQETPEGAACDFARAFVNRDAELFKKTCLAPYAADKGPEGYAEFLDAKINEIKKEADNKEPSPGGPKSIAKVFAARHLSKNGPASYGYAVFGFQDVMFVDIGVLLHNDKKVLNRTLLIKDKNGKWYVHPMPSADGLLSLGLNQEKPSEKDFSEAYKVEKPKKDETKESRKDKLEGK